MAITIIILIISIALYLVMFLYFKWYIKHRTSGAGLMPEYRDEINRLKADINAVTDRNLLLVEEKIKELKEILESTDKRISVYVKELEKSRKGEELYTNLGRGIRAALKTEAPALSTVMPNVTAIQQTPPAVQQTLPLETKPAEPQKPTSKRQIRAYIDLLANEGISPREIASRLEISIAEVDLAMNLRDRK
jgi:transposase